MATLRSSSRAAASPPLLEKGKARYLSRRVLPSLLALAIVGHGVSAEPTFDGWRTVIMPYLLVPSISGEAGIGRLDAAPIDIDSAGIFDHLESGFMLRADIGYDRWSLLLDGAYMDLAADGEGSGGREAELAFTQLIAEACVAYRSGRPDAWFDVLVGARAWRLEMEGRFLGPQSTGSRRMEADWVDPIIGLRGGMRLHSAWSLSARYDRGGFGVGSEHTWQVELGVVWQAMTQLAVVAGYRALDVDYTDGDRGNDDWFRYNVLTHGPQVGVSISF